MSEISILQFKSAKGSQINSIYTKENASIMMLSVPGLISMTKLLPVSHANKVMSWMKTKFVKRSPVSNSRMVNVSKPIQDILLSPKISLKSQQIV